MLRSWVITLLVCATLPISSAQADNIFKSKPDGEKRVQVSSVFTNDFLGDGDDRWRTGSLDVSATFGGGDLRFLPEKAWERYQIRVRSEIIAPENLSAVVPSDRQYAGVLGFGLFTHFQKREIDLSYGGELVFVGESTGLGSFQRSFHEDLNITPPSDAVLANQIPNEIFPTAHFGASKSYRRENRLFRPFFEVQAGVETFARAGADVIFGSAMVNDFLLRDTVSGQLISHSKADDSKGFGFLLGADAAYVTDSQLLPEENGFDVKELRTRARAGIVFQSRKFDIFYGVSWLGEEYEAQRESQFVGSLSLKARF